MDNDYSTTAGGNNNYFINWQIKPKSPFCCPICMGKGIVMSGFYSLFGETGQLASKTSEMCKTCNGKGIIWG